MLKLTDCVFQSTLLHLDFCQILKKIKLNVPENLCSVEVGVCKKYMLFYLLNNHVHARYFIVITYEIRVLLNCLLWILN